MGEQFLKKATGKDFRHEVFGVVVAQKIERSGKGLNLTYQVLEGMLNHSRGKKELETAKDITPEANVVMVSDKSYIWSDFNDVFERTSLQTEDYPNLAENVAWFGSNQRERSTRHIVEFCKESADAGLPQFEKSEAAQRFSQIKKAMYTVYEKELNYKSRGVRIEEGDLGKVYNGLSTLLQGRNIDPAVAFALLSDRELLYLVKKEGKITMGDMQKISLGELLLYLVGVKFDDPDLNW